MKKKIVFMLALSALVFSCSKDDKKSTNELIIGKWNLVNHYENQYYNNANHRDTIPYQPGEEIMEFRNNGMVYGSGFDNNGTPYKDTGVYKVEGSNLIIDTYDTIKISNISGSDLQLFSRYEYSADDWVELWANYKK
jgi:hypothetical protein